MDGDPRDPADAKRLPLAGRGHTSAARVLDDWYVACPSSELGRKPRRIEMLNTAIALFRDEAGQVGALLDRCPHRNVALSKGEVAGTRLRCGYHGWEFARGGECEHVPCFVGEPQHRGRRVPAFPVRERDGLIWVYGTPDVEPRNEPYAIPKVDDPAYAVVHQQFEVPGTLHAVAENALDVPHTAFLHKGLFRGTGEPNDIEVVVRRWHDRVEAEYIGEPRPQGVAGRILAPGGGVVVHYDRFILPCIAQVDYALGERSHILISSMLTPITDKRTRLSSVTCVRLPVPGAVVAKVLKPLAKAIFAQDARILEEQADNIERFEGEQFVSTELDALGPGILRLLRNAERGEREPMDEPDVRRFTMRV